MDKKNIIAIGSSPKDLETGCLGSISKFASMGFCVHVVIAAKKSSVSGKDMSSFSDTCKKLGITEITYAEKFVNRSTTQENVQILRSIIEPLNPVLVLFPSPTGDEILGRSSMLACRGVGSMLMYDGTMGKGFAPKIFFPIEKKNIHSNKIKALQLGKKYAKYAGLNGTITAVEAFDTNRMLLLDNDIF